MNERYIVSLLAARQPAHIAAMLHLKHTQYVTSAPPGNCFSHSVPL